MSFTPVPFEIHLTVADLSEDRDVDFLSFCTRYEAKPLMIVLARGVTQHQPMLSKVVTELHTGAAMKQAQTYARLLRDEDFTVSRLKLEIPAYCAANVEVYATPSFLPYFEWHGKIAFQDTEHLLKLCGQHNVHLSRNSLRNETRTMFLTLREFGANTIFEQRLEELKIALHQGGWQLYKEQAEYCIYDSNITLDQGWLS